MLMIKRNDRSLRIQNQKVLLVNYILDMEIGMSVSGPLYLGRRGGKEGRKGGKESPVWFQYWS